MLITPVESQIVDGSGGEYQAEVSKYNALYVSQRIPDVPPVGTENRYRFLKSKLGSTGFDSGTVNQRVDGSVTPVQFYGGSHADYDIYVTGIAILIADTAIVHNNFGNVGALANGWDLLFRESGDDTYLINSASTGGQVIAQSGFARPYGDAALTWELANWTGTEDAQTIFIPVANYIPGGLRIGRGTQDQIISIVNDNLTGLTEFYQECFGYRHIYEE